MVTWRHTSLYLFYNKSCLLDFHSMTLRTPGCIIRTPSLPPSVSVWQGWVGEIPTTLPPPPPNKKSPVWIFGNSTCLMRNGTFQLHTCDLNHHAIGYCTGRKDTKTTILSNGKGHSRPSDRTEQKGPPSKVVPNLWQDNQTDALYRAGLFKAGLR